MKKVIWLLGLILIIAFTAVNLTVEMSTVLRLLNPLLLAAFFCLYRVWRGPTPADRAVAIDILGILIVGFCGILAIFTERSFFIDIAIASHVLEHVYDDKSTLKELHRILKQGGFLAILVPINEKYKDPKHFRQYTFATCRKLIENSGFRFKEQHDKRNTYRGISAWLEGI